MATHFHSDSNMLPSLVLLGILSGCTSVGPEVIVDIAVITSNPDSMQNEPRHNYYEPTILSSTGDMIRIKYLDVNSNAQHEQVMQLMIDHCDGSYIEISRVNEEGWTTVEAECTHDTDS
jgi:hypothetical protein